MCTIITLDLTGDATSSFQVIACYTLHVSSYSMRHACTASGSLWFMRCMQVGHFLALRGMDVLYSQAKLSDCLKRHDAQKWRRMSGQLNSMCASVSDWHDEVGGQRGMRETCIITA